MTFLSTGSLNYLSTVLPQHQIFSQYEEIKEIKCQLNSLDGKRQQLISFDDESNQCLGKIVKNSTFDNILTDILKANKNIDIRDNSADISIENTLDGINLNLDNGDTLKSKLFILSSSKNKSVLNSIKINFVQKDFYSMHFRL